MISKGESIIMIEKAEGNVAFSTRQNRRTSRGFTVPSRMCRSKVTYTQHGSVAGGSLGHPIGGFFFFFWISSSGTYTPRYAHGSNRQEIGRQSGDLRRAILCLQS